MVNGFQGQSSHSFRSLSTVLSEIVDVARPVVKDQLLYGKWESGSLWQEQSVRLVVPKRHLGDEESLSQRCFWCGSSHWNYRKSLSQRNPLYVSVPDEAIQQRNSLNERIYCSWYVRTLAIFWGRAWKLVQFDKEGLFLQVDLVPCHTILRIATSLLWLQSEWKVEQFYHTLEAMLLNFVKENKKLRSEPLRSFNGLLIRDPWCNHQWIGIQLKSRTRSVQKFSQKEFSSS